MIWLPWVSSLDRECRQWSWPQRVSGKIKRDYYLVWNVAQRLNKNDICYCYWFPTSRTGKISLYIFMTYLGKKYRLWISTKIYLLPKKFLKISKKYFQDSPFHLSMLYYSGAIYHNFSKLLRLNFAQMGANTNSSTFHFTLSLYPQT